MEAPKELYIQRYSYGALVPGYTDKPVKMADGENIKYIRSDLVVEKEKLVDYLTEIKENTPSEFRQFLCEEHNKKLKTL